MFLKYVSDPDRTTYSQANAYCPRCGCGVVHDITGDMGFFYQCAACGSGVWEDFGSADPGEWAAYRCAWCGRLAEALGRECPACGRLVAFPVKRLPEGRTKVVLFPGAGRFVFPSPRNIRRY